MPGDPSPSPVGQTHGAPPPDGPLCKAPVPPPVPVGTPNREQQDFQSSINELEAEATQFAQRHIEDGALRQQYMQQANMLSTTLRKDVCAVAAVRHDLIAFPIIETETNIPKRLHRRLRKTVRLSGDDLFRGDSDTEQLRGKSLTDLHNVFATKLYNRPFAALNVKIEGKAVFRAIVDVATQNHSDPDDVELREEHGDEAKRTLMFQTKAIQVYNLTSANPSNDADESTKVSLRDFVEGATEAYEAEQATRRRK